MRKYKFLVPVLLLCGLLGGCATQPATQAAGAEPIQSKSDVQEDETEAEALAAYASYGLSFDAKTRQLTYDGKRVRYFEDIYPIVWDTPADGMAGMTFFDEEGVLDVYATRDLSVKRDNGDGSYDPSGVLTGLAPFSQTEFDARNLKLLKTPATGAVAGEPMTAAELEALYAPYAAHGLTYDAKKDVLFFGGRQVRRFTDVLSTNGEDPEGGKFEGSMTSRWDEGGTVDIRALRDYTKPDAHGCGLLTGVEAATQTEFDAATKRVGEDEPSIRFYGAGATTACAQEG